MKKILLLSLVLMSFSALQAKIVMAGNYWVSAELGENPCPAEMTARDELVSHLRLVFGKFKQPGKNIFLGRAPENVKFFSLKRLEQLEEEEFIIQSDKNGNIYIAGGRERGTLYGVYYFLDRILGVRWYTPDFTYLPKIKSIELDDLNIQQKPKFAFRPVSGGFLPHIYSGHRPDPCWASRNLFNNTFPAIKRQYISETFGSEYLWSPPLNCHGMIELIPSSIYFKTNPEFFALYRGKRVGRGVASDYCLSNPELLEETIKRIRFFMAQRPDSRLVSVQEGDYTVAPCECEKCQAMLKKYVKESGMWLDFTNRVAERLEKEFPKVIFVTFAYDRTQKPPENIKARSNVGVQICAWGISRGVPYDDPRNTYRGKRFVDNVIKPWSNISENLLFWDYIYAPGEMGQDPNPLIQVKNMQMFSSYTKLGVFNENHLGDFFNGQPFKSFLMGRLEWNPWEVNAEEELKLFCDRYYGEAGKIVFAYWKNLRDVNERQGFCNILLGGTIGDIKANFESFDTTMKSYKLYQEALKAVNGNQELTFRVKNAFLAMLYHICYRQKEWKAELLKKGIDIQIVFNDTLQHLEEIDAESGSTDSTDTIIAKLKRMYALRHINAVASDRYGNNDAELAYDGNLRTYYHGGTQRSWCQREFENPVKIRRIITVLAEKSNLEATYCITGSMDGKNWFDVIKTSTTKIHDNDNFLYADNTLEKTVTVKYLRTLVYKVILPQNRTNDATLHEQYINPAELPEGLVKP